jgi:UDP-N-acetylmuramate--alanine ligase
MRRKRGIAVAGTHGKTTTSAMTSMILSEAGLDPTIIVGGVLRNLGTSAVMGSSDLLVAEADEFDRSFLALHPQIAVITNIEADHLDCYRDLDDIRAAFGQFAAGIAFYGLVVGCVDDAGVAVLLDRVPRRALRYGLAAGAELLAAGLEFSAAGSEFDAVLRGQKLEHFRLRVPAEHNVRNALGAIGVGVELGLKPSAMVAALEQFRGVERRFDHIGDYAGIPVIDDYAHHPTEIRATLNAARRTYAGRRLVALFQPHPFSRTRDFAAGFADALGEADLALVAPIYPAREQPVEGVTAALIADQARRLGRTAVSLIEGNHADIARELRRILEPNDVLVAMGAGDVNAIARALVGGGGA